MHTEPFGLPNRLLKKCCDGARGRPRFFFSGSLIILFVARLSPFDVSVQKACSGTCKLFTSQAVKLVKNFFSNIKHFIDNLKLLSVTDTQDKKSARAGYSGQRCVSDKDLAFTPTLQIRRQIKSDG